MENAIQKSKGALEQWKISSKNKVLRSRKIHWKQGKKFQTTVSGISGFLYGNEYWTISLQMNRIKVTDVVLGYTKKLIVNL